MKDPIVGGYTPDKIALRRAISLGYKTQDEISIIAKTSPIPAHTPYARVWPAMIRHFAPAPANTIRPRRERCLTCTATSIGMATAYREMPDGTPLVLKIQFHAE